MKPRYVFAPEAARDLAAIWKYIRKQSSEEMADRVEATILEKILFLTENPCAGHRRTSLCGENIRFFPVYSYLIVYQADRRPLQVISILHGRRDVKEILATRGS